MEARTTGRLRSLLTSLPEEDGVFRPVRLPRWVDVGIALGIVVVMLLGFVGFFTFLALTNGR